MRLSTLIPAGGCKGSTKEGQPCKAKNVYQNDFCKAHGGEGQSLIERRAALRIELERRRTAKMLKSIDRLLKRSPPNVRRMVEEARQRRALREAEAAK